MGLTSTAKARALTEILTGAWIGLFTTLPADDGTGGVEVNHAYMMRTLITTGFDTVIAGSETSLQNTFGIDLDYMVVNQPGVVGWGIFDAPNLGNLLAFGPLLTAGGVATTVNFVAGDIPRFLARELKIGID